MVRILILAVVGLLSFSIVFGLGYLFIVPHDAEMMQMEESEESQGDMVPAEESMMKSDSDDGAVEPPPPPPPQTK
ncbi:MAG: hypothetical protein HQM13_04320 [SAR324 cluster bacterium]|nr:hypothetical protein [SAR324 cluster bacterium]